MAALGLWLFVAAAAGGCTSTLSSIPVLGEPDHLPKRPETTSPYPAVHDMPAARDTKPLTEPERKKLEAELAAARDQQETETNTVQPKPAGK